MKRSLPAILIALCLLICAFSMSVYAKEKEVMLCDCDSNVNWYGGVTLDTREKTQGRGSISTTVKLSGSGTNLALYHPFVPVNAKGYNTLVLDFYISDPDFFDHASVAHLELTSSGTWDLQEAAWEFKVMLEEGWNTLSFLIPENTCIMQKLNFIRLYALDIQPYTKDAVVIKIDNIRCTYTDPSQQGANVKGVNIGSLSEATENVKNALPSDTPITATQTEIYLRTELLILAIAAWTICAAGVVLFLLFVRKKKAVRIVSLCLSVVFLAGGTASFVFYRVEQTRKIQVPVPQMDQADAERLLTVDPTFDSKEAYKGIYDTPIDQGAEPDSNSPYNFREPTLIQSALTPEQNIVALTSVVAFGAKGDGIANDTAAFLAAIEYANSKGGGAVFVPAGNYCITSSISIPQGVALVGELEPGTVNGTVLQIYHGKGSTSGSPAISMAFQSGLKNMAFWYPEQTFVNGAPIPYAPTVAQNGSEGITLENLNFVNSYIAMDLQKDGHNSNSLQMIRNICGTPLYLGSDNSPSYDIGRFENISFTPDYWLCSGLPGAPEQQLLTTWLLRNATGIRIGRVDWTYYADITVRGYRIGMEYYVAKEGASNGHLYNAMLTECYYPIVCSTPSHLNITKSTLSAIGNDGAVALYFTQGATTYMNLNHCTITSAGKNAIYNPDASTISLVACAVTSNGGTPFVTTKNSLYTAVNTTFTGAEASYRNETAEITPIPNVDYNRNVVTKPKSDLLIDMSKEPYSIKTDEDITAVLQQALDSLKETGGTVYLPGGSFTLNGPITVWAGIELTGAQDVAHYFPHTVLNTNYGENDENGQALITLMEGAGLRGIGIKYNQISKHGANLPPYAFTIRGNGANIYIVNCSIPFVYNGVDFETYRCDNHYIEFLWGCAANIGITVGGGSENGIIRDCMFTQNTSWTVAGNTAYIATIQPILCNQSTTFRVAETKNQILYHNFVYAAYKGLEITDGAENCFVLSHGTDYGNNSIYLSGKASVTLVDPQLVAMSGNDKYYLYADETFTGSLNVYNLAAWGNPRSSFVLKGNADYRFYSAFTSAPGNNLFTIERGSLQIAGAHRHGTVKFDIKATDQVKAITVTGLLTSSKPLISIPESVNTSGIS